MIKQPSFWRKARRVLLCLAMLFMFERAVMPAPAQAYTIIVDPTQAVWSVLDAVKKVAGWAAEKLQLTSYITLLTDTYEDYVEDFVKWYTTTSDNSAAEVANEAVATERRVKQYHAIYETRTQNTVAATEAKFIAQHTPPKNVELCRSILVHQAVTTTLDFAREISRMIVEGLNNRGRYAGSNEPLEVIKDLVHQCGGDLKMGSKLDGHNGCYNDASLSIKGTDGRMFADSMYFRPDPNQVYEMPMIEAYQYTDPITKQRVELRYPAKADGPNQSFWLSAFQNLYHLVGSRPIPLSGAGLRSPVGLTQRVMFNHCIANQNALIKQCADELAFYTRPNSKDPLLATVRAKQKKLCEATRKSLSAETLQKRYGNCEEGLSAYEAHRLQLEWCLATNQTLAQKAAGATDAEATASSNLCADQSTSLSNMVELYRYNCNAAVTAMKELDNCWDSVRALGAGK